MRNSTDSPLHPRRALYAQVADAIVDHIKANGLKKGDRLPSQTELMAEHGVSQSTVRQALLNLSNRGLARAEQGRGVFVDEPHLNVSVGDVSVVSRITGDVSVVTFEHIESESVFAPERIANILNVDEGTPVVRIRRILRSDMRLLGLETTNLPFEVMQILRRKDIQSRSIEEALASHEEWRPVRSRLKVSAGPITDFDADVLGVSQDTTALQKEETFFGRDDRPTMMQRTALVARNVDLVAEVKR